MSIEKPVPHLPDTAWFKSSHSSGEGGECVEVAVLSGRVHVRDSKDKSGPALSLTPTDWAAFVGFAAGLEA
jgi:hypothetical protein